MRRRTIVSSAAVLGLAAGVTGGAVALAGGGDDEGPSVTGRTADRAIAAALKATGGGTANSVERDSENGATWEVEVTRPDGRTVDVRLGRTYGVVVIESDSERPDPAS